MTKEEFTEEYKTQIYARRWWNFGEQPPAEYYYKVGEYIKCHPEEFNGAGPQ